MRRHTHGWRLAGASVLTGLVVLAWAGLSEPGWPGSSAVAAAQGVPAGSPVPRAGGRAGVAGPAAPGAAVDAGRLPDQPAGETPAQPREIPRRYPVDPGTFGRLKAAAAQAAAERDRGLGQGVLPPPGPPPEFATVSYTGWNPPDAGLAVGPAHVLVVVNESYSVYNRAGARLSGPKSLGSLFGTTDSTFDPRALYDPAQGRFVVLSTAASYLTLAVSQTGDPNGLWCTYRLVVDASGVTWSDYPGLGMDGDHLYVTTNQFANADNSFRYAQLQAIPKASVYSGLATAGCPIATPLLFGALANPGGGNAFTVQPATQPDARPGQSGPMHFVNAIWANGNNLAVRAITRATNGALLLDDPQWVASGYIAPYDLPADAPQPQGRNIDTGDTRLLGAVFRYGKIYAANTTLHVTGIAGATPNAFANAQWYEITPNSLSDSFAASHAVTSSTVAFFFPHVLPGCASSPCASPSVVLEVSGTGRSRPASAFWTRGASPTTYASGVSGYTLSSRWGDYAAVAADPAATGPVWVLGEYAQSGGGWGTAATSVSP